MSNIDISYLLPTCRVKNHPEVVQFAIDSVNRQPTNFSYEILVYSTDEVVGDNVKWIKENKRQGPIFAINTMAQKIASGNYFVTLSDDLEMINSIDHCINMIESEFFKHRDFKICGLSCGNPCALSQRNSRMGNVTALKEDWPKANILRFVVVKRETVNKLLNGYIYHPQFYHAAGDIWLGYFLAMNNEPCIEGPTQILPTNSLHNPSFEVQDCNTAFALVHNFQNGEKYYVDTKFHNEYKDHIDTSDLFV